MTPASFPPLTICPHLTPITSYTHKHTHIGTNLPFHGLKATDEEADSVLADFLISGRPALTVPGNVRGDGKAACIVR